MSFPTSAFAAATLSLALQVGARQPLEYAPIPADVYTPPVGNSTVTLLDLVSSRPELSTLGEIIQMPAGNVPSKLCLVRHPYFQLTTRW